MAADSFFFIFFFASQDGCRGLSSRRDFFDGNSPSPLQPLSDLAAMRPA